MPGPTALAPATNCPCATPVADPAAACPVPNVTMACLTVSGRRIAPGAYALLRFDQVPPCRPHHPFTGDHYHYVQAHQRPDGKCFWNAGMVTSVPIPGALPRPESFV